MFENVRILGDEVNNLVGIAQSTEDPVLRTEILSFVYAVNEQVGKAFSDVYELLGKVAFLKSSELNEDAVRDLQLQLSQTHSSEKFKVLLRICDTLDHLAGRYQAEIQPKIGNEFTADSSSQLFWLLNKHEGAFKWTIKGAVDRIVQLLDDYQTQGDYAAVRKEARNGQNELREILETIVHITNKFAGELPGGTRTLLSQGSSTSDIVVEAGKIEHDVFICHASEDKQACIEPLVQKLKTYGIKCFYDRAEIRWGDSIIKKVNEGLRSSNYVLVALSVNTLRKNWPQAELEAALNLEFSSGKTKVLPLMIGTDDEIAEIKRAFPILSSKTYVRFSDGVEAICLALKSRLN